MAVRLRLKRMGAKGRPFYRIIVADQRSPRDGRFIETIGTYDPLPNPPAIKVKEDRLAYWMGVGVQPSDSVKRVLKTAGLLDEKGTAAQPPATAPEPLAEA
jgi:small subunit ribosomal protein S16